MKVAVVLFIFLLLVACSKSEPTKVVIISGAATKEVKSPVVEEKKDVAKSTVFFGVTDAALSLENVSSVLISVDKLSIHNKDGWKNLTTDQKIFDLYKLRGINLSEFLSLATLEKDFYDQVSISFSNPVIFRNGVAETAFITGKSLTFSLESKLSKPTYVIMFDFILDESLHQTIENQLVFAPVIKLVVNTADKVDLSSDRVLRITNPRQVDSQKLGIDEKGRTLPSTGIWHDARLVFDQGILRLA